MGGVAGDAVREIDQRVRAGGGERAPLGQPRLGAQVGVDEGAGAVGAPVEDREAGGGRAERAGHADEVARPRPVTADERALVVGPADDGHADHERRSARDVAARDRRLRPCRERPHPARQLEDAGGVDVRRHDDRDVGLARLGAHGREVRQRGGERAMACVGRRRRPEPEVHALDHRVDRCHRVAPRADHRGVVAAAAHHALAGRPELRDDRVDEAELVRGC